MTEDGSYLSHFSKKQFYVFVVIGLLILVGCAVFSYAADKKLESGTLTPEEAASQRNIYALTKIGSMIGFIIALVPSVKILQYEVLKKTLKKPDADSDVPASTKPAEKE